jgi:hypothetical protein
MSLHFLFAGPGPQQKRPREEGLNPFEASYSSAPRESGHQPPYGGKMTTKSAIRRKRLADLTCPILSPIEVDWFVRLQSKHKQGRSTNWQAMLHEWDTTLIQMSLDPNKKHLCTSVTHKLS